MMAAADPLARVRVVVNVSRIRLQVTRRINFIAFLSLAYLMGYIVFDGRVGQKVPYVVRSFCLSNFGLRGACSIHERNTQQRSS